MTKHKRLILTEDDESLRVALAHYLSMHGYTVRETRNGAELLALLGTSEFDAILLDPDPPDEDGLALLRRLRMLSDIPVVVISARKDAAFRIAALELRADDYMSKPFNPRELLLRLRRLLDNAHPVDEPWGYIAGPLHIDLRQRRVRTLDGAPVHLTTAEFNLLAALARAGGCAVNRTKLAHAATLTVERDGSESVTVLIHRLRRKLSETTKHSLILTVPRFGYRLAVESIHMRTENRSELGKGLF